MYSLPLTSQEERYLSPQGEGPLRGKGGGVASPPCINGNPTRLLHGHPPLKRGDKAPGADVGEFARPVARR